jgi:hypothetical protein
VSEFADGPRMTEDGWSEPRLYGAPLPVPGDALSLAVATAEPETATPWSPPIYHGPRRWRPRPADEVAQYGPIAEAD